MMKSKAFEDGLAMRKKVLGPDYVEKTIRDADALLLPFQELLTEFAWGKVWTRPGLNLKTRSLLTLSMCIALNRPHEIKLHLRGALRNGVSKDEIRELLLHAFIYCGGPASVDAFNVVRTALPEIEALERANRKALRAAAAPAPAAKVAAKAKAAKRGAASTPVAVAGRAAPARRRAAA
jgi:4-carboxymuconolactone decarboxylase